MTSYADFLATKQRRIGEHGHHVDQSAIHPRSPRTRTPGTGTPGGGRMIVYGRNATITAGGVPNGMDPLAPAVLAILTEILPGPDVPAAACTGVQGGLWDEIRDVPARGVAEDPHERAQRLLAAQAICRTCPAIEQCRTRRHAIPGRLPGGIWAGQLYLEGCTEPRAIVCAYCPDPIPDVLRRSRSTTCGAEDCAHKAAVAAKRKARPPEWAPCARCTRRYRRRTCTDRYCGRDCREAVRVERQRATRASLRAARTTEMAA